MNYNEFEKNVFKQEVQNLVKNTDLKAADDCYCLLMKQIFLSKSTLN